MSFNMSCWRIISLSEPASKYVYRIFSALARRSALATWCAGEFESDVVRRALLMKLGLVGFSAPVPRPNGTPVADLPDPRLL